jgi:hypothetical protein
MKVASNVRQVAVKPTRLLKISSYFAWKIKFPVYVVRIQWFSNSVPRVFVKCTARL